MRFDVDPEDIGGKAPTFATAATELGGAVARLRSALGALGAPWGDDAQGAAFHTVYEPHAETVAGATDNVTAGLSSIAGGLTAMGDNHTTTEAGVTSGLRAR